MTINVDEKILADAQDRLAEMGLTIDDAVDSLLHHIVEQGSLPFQAEPLVQEEQTLLAELYGETPTADTLENPGFLEEEEADPFLNPSSGS